jgi:signal peptidase II
MSRFAVRVLRPQEDLMQRSPFIRHDRLVHAVALAVVTVDALGKWWALAVVSDAPMRLPGFAFRISLDSGIGAVTTAWLGDGASTVMAVADALLVGAVVLAAGRIRAVEWAVAAGLGAGAVASDLIDRLARPPGVLRGALVHWIDPAWSTSFNIADVALAAAVVLTVSLTPTRPS